ncbi:MAG: hypothetical protein KatS3mg111_2787 [Pirellulaceae bacterium]|nr:MAG: hypothetical protein KatS3mg111_2787 [Pirellulaceae bacterium]
MSRQQVVACPNCGTKMQFVVPQAARVQLTCPICHNAFQVLISRAAAGPPVLDAELVDGEDGLASGGAPPASASTAKPQVPGKPVIPYKKKKKQSTRRHASPRPTRPQDDRASVAPLAPAEAVADVRGVEGDAAMPDALGLGDNGDPLFAVDDLSSIEPAPGPSALGPPVPPPPARPSMLWVSLGIGVAALLLIGLGVGIAVIWLRPGGSNSSLAGADAVDGGSGGALEQDTARILREVASRLNTRLEEHFEALKQVSSKAAQPQLRKRLEQMEGQLLDDATVVLGLPPVEKRELTEVSSLLLAKIPQREAVRRKTIELEVSGLLDEEHRRLSESVLRLHEGLATYLEKLQQIDSGAERESALRQDAVQRHREILRKLAAAAKNSPAKLSSDWIFADVDALNELSRRYATEVGRGTVDPLDYAETMEGIQALREALMATMRRRSGSDDTRLVAALDDLDAVVRAQEKAFHTGRNTALEGQAFFRVLVKPTLEENRPEVLEEFLAQVGSELPPGMRALIEQHREMIARAQRGGGSRRSEQARGFSSGNQSPDTRAPTTSASIAPVPSAAPSSVVGPVSNRVHSPNGPLVEALAHAKHQPARAFDGPDSVAIYFYADEPSRLPMVVNRVRSALRLIQSSMVIMESQTANRATLSFQYDGPLVKLLPALKGTEIEIADSQSRSLYVVVKAD